MYTCSCIAPGRLTSQPIAGVGYERVTVVVSCPLTGQRRPSVGGYSVPHPSEPKMNVRLAADRRGWVVGRVVPVVLAVGGGGGIDQQEEEEQLQQQQEALT